MYHLAWQVTGWLLPRAHRLFMGGKQAAKVGQRRCARQRWTLRSAVWIVDLVYAGHHEKVGMDLIGNCYDAMALANERQAGDRQHPQWCINVFVVCGSTHSGTLCPVRVVEK